MASKSICRRVVTISTLSAAAGMILYCPEPVQAASFLNSCTTYCHGMPPRDAARKGNPHYNSMSSAFSGNHQTHMKAAPAASDCDVCHTPVAATNFGHQNGVIRMANSLKGYSSSTLRAKYDKGVFFNQTSLPNLTNARCSNTNCHFERQTPLWGSAAYVAPTNCNACHGAPPAGTTAAPAGGLAGSHARHDAYYPTVTNCQKCHPGYTTFTHATSTGQPLKVQGYLRDPLNVLDAGGTYTGTGTNYLPSKSGTPGFGSCSTIYCHSSSQGTAGTGTITYRTVTWGSAALTCGSCHQNMGPAANTSATGSHLSHAQTSALDCSICHTAGYTSTSVPTGAGTIHVNKLINIGFTGTNATGTAYSKGTSFSPGTAYGSCSTSKCHGSGTVVWGGALWSTTDQCGKCHSSTSAGAVTATTPFFGTSFPIKVTSNTDPKVGAHTSHITSTDSLSASLNCTDCHGTVTLNSTTHMSGTTNFAWSTLATRSGALTPTYTAATGACANVYCHGAAMPGGDTTGTNRSPIWDVPFLPATLTAAACGNCHGFPPTAASGHPGVIIPAGFPTTATIGTTCSCHTNINSAGNSYANIFVNKTLHINGITEVIAGGTCDACHGYPPASAAFVGTQNNWTSARSENYPGGGGAHTINNHVSKFAKPSEGFANCSKCHDSADHRTSPIVFNPSQNIKVTVSKRYRLEAAKQFKYTSNRLDGAAHLTGTCSNNSCHYGATPKWDPLHYPSGGRGNPPAPTSLACKEFAERRHKKEFAMGKRSEGSKSCSQMVVGITALMSLILSAGTVQAASVLNSCTTYCHGAPPRDGVRKGNPHFNSQSSAIPGNHRNHLSATLTATTCSICHTPVSLTNFGHQNGVISMANSLKGYSSATIRAKYDKGIFFNLTSIPNLTNARCSNVNCHFEKQTPVWGAAATGTTCETCHGALISPLTLAHPKHIVALGNTITACTSCHNSYSGTTAYSHATSAGRPITVKVGAYTGSNYKYFPSQTGRITGTCSLVVCHGSGTQLPWSGTLWSTTDQCGKCHSSSATGAITQTVPFYSTAYPVKVIANTDAKVGAHTNHMTSQALGISASTACTDCHGTVTLTASTHMNGTTTFVWSALATKNGTLTPVYTAATGQCTATYCHGNSMPGGDTTGTNKSPTWINPNYLPATISAAACGTCHGFPPSTASGHPGSITIPAGFPATATIGTTCSCHSNINTAGNSYANIFVNPALHINGIFEPAASGHAFPYSGSLHLSAAGVTPWSSCSGCHSTAAGGTYPVAAGTAPNCTGCHIQGLRTPSGTSSCWDCHGASATDGKPNGKTFPNISGNHSIHVALTGATCATCHTGGGTGTVTHGSSNRIAATAASVKVAFTGQGTSPLWTLTTKTCSATNCHGQGTPTWGARAGAVVNGFPYSSIQCEKCHGSKTSNPFYSNAIPKVTTNTNAKVGAHFMHLTSSTLKISKTIHCNDCHAVPATVTATTHMNGSTNFTWSALATKSGALAPTYTVSTATCANVYCHGASMPGGDTTGTNRTPTWNVPFMSATLSRAACASCHGFPPATTSGHPAVTLPASWPATGAVTGALGTTCSCHANISTTGTTYANIFVNKAQHIDGTLQVSGGHAVPYDTHKTAVVAAGGNTACLGCHAMGTAASVYPAAVVGNPPDCMSCHKKAAPLHSGTAVGANCSSCHGLSTATTTKIGRPVGTAYPDRVGYHSGSQDSAHGTAACTVCHSGAGTTSGNNSGINHGKGSTAGPVRNGKPNVVGPMVNGITPTNSAKGVGIPAGGTTCAHSTISSGCSGGGTRSNAW